MRAKIYEQYYKLGFDHLIFKRFLHLKKPKKAVRQFYIALLLVIIMLALLLQ